MTVRLYETLFLLDSTKVAADGDATRNQLHALLEKHGAEILVGRPWDENRKLAYPIKKQKKGYYYAIYYKANTTKLIDMEREFAITEVILRQLTSAIEPKWEEAIMEVARNDHSQAFSLRIMQDDAAPADITPNLAGVAPSDFNGSTSERPRSPRGPRREMAEKPE